MSINDRTREQAIFVGHLVLENTPKKKIAEITRLNENSVNRMIKILPQIDAELHDKVMKHIEEQTILAKAEKIKASEDKKMKTLPKDYIRFNSKQEKTETILKVADMVLGGKKQNDIAKEIGCSGATVSKWMSEDLAQIDSDKYEKVREITKSNCKSGGMKPNDEIRKASVKLADYIIEHNCNIAEARRSLGIKYDGSYCINKILPGIDGQKFKQVRNIVDSHKKASTPANQTVTGLEKVTYEFKKIGGEPMHNSVAVCKYILDNKCSITDAANYFGTTEAVMKANIDYMKRLDEKKYARVISLGLRGNYTGGDCVLVGRGKKLTEEQRKQNSHNVCDFIIVNNASLQNACDYFGMSRCVVDRNVDAMARYDYEKYLKVKDVQQKNTHNHVIILANPNVKEVDEVPTVTGVESRMPSEAACNAFKQMIDDVNSAVDVVVKEAVDEVKKDCIIPEEPVKMTFWQRVKYVFGFGG